MGFAHTFTHRRLRARQTLTAPVAFMVKVRLVVSLLAVIASSCDAAPPALAEVASALARVARALDPGGGCPDSVRRLPAPARDDPRLEADPLVVVLKSRRVLAHYDGGALVPGGCYRIGLAAGGRPGDKRREGDLRTPEGWYRTSDKPWSQFYKAIAVHYPNRRDAARGLAAGRIDRTTHRAIVRAIARGDKPPQKTPLGGEILIHGGGGGRDWTAGCVAMDDGDLDALRGALPDDLSFWMLILP